MSRIARLALVVLLLAAIGAVTACYNKPPKDQTYPARAH